MLDGIRCIDPGAAPRRRRQRKFGRRRAARRMAGGRSPRADRARSDRRRGRRRQAAGNRSASPDEPGAKGTLADHARTMLRALGRGADAALSVVHRLDRDTAASWCSRATPRAKRHLAAQFRAHPRSSASLPRHRARATWRDAARPIRCCCPTARRAAGLPRHFRRGPRRRAAGREARRDERRAPWHRSRAPRWSNCRLGRAGSTRSASTSPSSATRWSASASTSATTRGRRIEAPRTMLHAARSLRGIAHRRAASCSTAEPPRTSGRWSMALRQRAAPGPADPATSCPATAVGAARSRRIRACSGCRPSRSASGARRPARTIVQGQAGDTPPVVMLCDCPMGVAP